MRRFKYPARYRSLIYFWLLVVLWFASGYAWFVMTQARQEVGAWVRLAIILGLGLPVTYFLLRSLKAMSRVLEVDPDGLRVLLYGREEGAFLWSEVRGIRERQRKKLIEILVGETGRSIPVHYQLTGYDELRQYLANRTGY